MKNTVRLLAVFVALGLASTAGATATSYPLTIDRTTRTASGSIADARRSGQMLGCYLLAYPTTLWMSCLAQSTDGPIFTCCSQKPELVELAAMVRDDSVIRFRADPSGECTLLDSTEVTATSESYPKAR